MINLDELTLGQLKEIQAIGNKAESNNIATKLLGEKVIVRTYSAGVWFGVLEEKDGEEVVIKNGRRMWRWWAAESISLSSVSIHGIKREKSKICRAVDNVWIKAIEIIPCSAKAIESIEGAEDVKAE